MNYPMDVAKIYVILMLSLRSYCKGIKQVRHSIPRNSCVLLFVVVLSGEPKQNHGRGLVDRKLVQAPSILIAGRPKAALLFWFFGDVRNGVPLFIVILVTYEYKNR